MFIKNNNVRKLFITLITICFFYILIILSDSLSINASAAEVTSEFSMRYRSNDIWTEFPGTYINGNVDGIKIQNKTANSFYINYRTQNFYYSGDTFYPFVSSRDSDYAGSRGKPLMKVDLRAYDNNNIPIKTNIVIMYRALVDGVWLPWVSNADPEWMESVQVKYNLGGTLDTKAYFAGIYNRVISGLEIHIYNEATTEITPVGNYKIINAPFISQLPNYPTGCESVSTVMALNYNNIPITVDQFIDNYLYKTETNFDPNISFGGDPRVGGYGCYSPVIMNALDSALTGKDFYAKELKNVPLQTLCSDYIDKNIPVIFWATINMNAPSAGNSWIYEGRTITWIKPEHCLLLVGYDDIHYIFNDPMKTKALTYYSKSDVEIAYNGMLSQAVVIMNGTDPEKVPVEPLTNKKLGAVGREVLWIQKQLNLFGYNLEETSSFDAATDLAVRDFQKKHYLDIDGIVGINTITSLKIDPENEPGTGSGDANMDGVLDVKDLVYLKKYIALGDASNYSIHFKAVDLLADEQLNSADIIMERNLLLNIK